MAHIMTATLMSDSPYSHRKYIDTKIDVEQNTEVSGDHSRNTHDAREERVWRKGIHTTKDGNVFIPGMCFKLALETAAKNYMGVKKGKEKWTKHFTAGVLVTDPIVLPDKAAEVDFDVLYVPSDGRKGGSSRVRKCFMRIDQWQADVPFTVLDDEITNETFVAALKKAGQLCGIGMYRPMTGGYYGRFRVLKVVRTSLEGNGKPDVIYHDE